jgi:hypothetical protein
VLNTAEDALFSAAEAEDETSMEVDKKFEDAINLLRALEKNFPFDSKDLNNPTSDSKIGGAITSEANMSDSSVSPSTILDSLEKHLYIRVKFPSVF